MIKIRGKVDKFNTDNEFSGNISFFIHRTTSDPSSSSLNKERNITTKPVVNV